VSSTPAGNKSGIARFGVFEFDPVARELRKQGRKLRLQEQPFAVLAVLLVPGVWDYTVSTVERLFIPPTSQQATTP